MPERVKKRCLRNLNITYYKYIYIIHTYYTIVINYYDGYYYIYVRPLAGLALS